MFSLRSNSCKKSRKAEHTNLSCKICFGSSTEISLFLGEKNLKSGPKRKVFKSVAQERLLYGAGVQPGGGHGRPCLAAPCLQRAAFPAAQESDVLANKHLSFQNAIADEIREFQK